VKGNSKPLGMVWVDCPGSVVGTGLVQALRQHAWVHTGKNPPPEGPSCVIICANAPEDLSERLEHHRELSPDEPPILVFGLYLNLPLAREALQAGGSGFIHAEMTTSQLLRAVAVAQRGELVAPRQLLRYMLTEEDPVDLAALSARQREILGFVVEGLSNAEIARRLYLSESTVKQHLRGAYKLLGASNRTEAARLFRRSP
jgi:DNA-binding NarL/FixJ family response regulator